jgi:hypothetical protein
MPHPTHPHPTATVGDPALAYLTGPGDRRAITDACAGLGLAVAATVREAAGDDARPELHRALDHVADGGARCLVVRRLDDLARGPDGLEPVLERVEADNIRLVALDVGLDTGLPVGRLAVARRPRADAPEGRARPREGHAPEAPTTPRRRRDPL